ncbi:hypothetical protein CULT_1040005 [[Clostridium] ultunense Esp]|nr:hypothetical protein CULT_1040005 [[Clostridium] ultunense Esp]
MKDQELSDPSSLALNEGTLLNTFQQGSIPFMLNWSFAANALKNNQDIKLALIPGVKGISESSTVTGGGALGIVKASQNKDWAWKLIQLANDKRNEIVANDYIGSLPVWNDMADNPSLKERYPYLQLMINQFEYAMSRPAVAAYSDWSQVMQSAIASALVGDKTPKEALNEVKKIMENKNIK